MMNWWWDDSCIVLTKIIWVYSRWDLGVAFTGKCMSNSFIIILNNLALEAMPFPFRRSWYLAITPHHLLFLISDSPSFLLITFFHFLFLILLPLYKYPNDKILFLASYEGTILLRIWISVILIFYIKIKKKLKI